MIVIKRQGILLERTNYTSSGYFYSATAALLDSEDPSRDISRLPYSLFEPERDYERFGYVNNVVFRQGQPFSKIRCLYIMVRLINVLQSHR